MEANGKPIRDAFEFLQQVFSETSMLLQTAEDALAERGLKSAEGSGCFWDRSAACNNPLGWMPSYLFRAYIDKGAEYYERMKFATLTVRFSPPQWDHPVLLFGVVRQRKTTGFWPFTKAMLLDEDSLSFAVGSSQKEWNCHEPEPPNDCFLDMMYRVIPLVSVDDAQVLQDEVIEPLVKLYRETEALRPPLGDD